MYFEYFLQLQAGHTVRLKKCRLHFDETDLSGSNVVIVEEVQVTGFKELEDPSGILVFDVKSVSFIFLLSL
jgi:hypothetical protein